MEQIVLWVDWMKWNESKEGNGISETNGMNFCCAVEWNESNAAPRSWCSAVSEWMESIDGGVRTARQINWRNEWGWLLVWWFIGYGWGPALCAAELHSIKLLWFRFVIFAFLSFFAPAKTSQQSLISLIKEKKNKEWNKNKLNWLRKEKVEWVDWGRNL